MIQLLCVCGGGITTGKATLCNEGRFSSCRGLNIVEDIEKLEPCFVLDVQKAELWTVSSELFREGGLALH